jgi:threonine/homoserine/homoserine lactone efflux protein
MLDLFINGIVVGLLVAISLGPAFFAVIQTGISQGFKFGFILSIGILLSDILMVVISYLIGSAFLDDPKNKVFVGLIGGIILIIFGSVSWAKKPDVLKRRSVKFKQEVKQPSIVGYLTKGFFLNIANPFIFFFWFGALGIVGKLAPEGELLQATTVFFTGTFIITFSGDLLKSYVGKLIRNFLSPRKELIINKIFGVMLVTFGIVLIFRTLNDYGFFDIIKEQFS